jgi:hypothetical protein
MVFAWLVYVAMIPFRGYLRRKYPKEYWQKRFDELEKNKS